MPDICIRLARPADCNQVARLREALWPKSSPEEHAREVALILNGKVPLTMPLTVLVAEASDQTIVGFLEAGLRSHADGCNPSRPVGYIEGWYVVESHRCRGIVQKLGGNLAEYGDQEYDRLVILTLIQGKAVKALTLRYGR